MIKTNKQTESSEAIVKGNDKHLLLSDHVTWIEHGVSELVILAVYKNHDRVVSVVLSSLVSQLHIGIGGLKGKVVLLVYWETMQDLQTLGLSRSRTRHNNKFNNFCCEKRSLRWVRRC